MALQIQTLVGPGNVNSADGVPSQPRSGRQNDVIISELHGRFYEQAYRNSLFSGGMALTSISNATFTVATTGATATPIVGIWNPTSSGVNAVVLQAHVNAIITAATNTGCGGFSWQTATGQAAITTGAAPMSRSTLLAVGSKCKDMSGAALTGLSGATVVRQGSSIACGSAFNFSFVGTAAGPATINVAGVENFDGGLIVPPGGILGLFANTTPVVHSAVSAILWEEVPV